MKQTIEVPDKEIELNHGDRIKIFINKKDIEFNFYCDGIGNFFTLTKDELKEMIENNKEVNGQETKSNRISNSAHIDIQQKSDSSPDIKSKRIKGWFPKEFRK